MTACISFKYRVRSGHQGDAKPVREIFLAALREHGFADTEANINSEIATFGARTDPLRDDFVVVSASKVCGFLILRPTTQPGCAELMKVFVARSHRGRGVGSMLIQRCVETAKARGFRELMLETHTAFRAARAHYEKHGWTLMPHWSGDESTTRVYTMRF